MSLEKLRSALRQSRAGRVGAWIAVVIFVIRGFIFVIDTISRVDVTRQLVREVPTWLRWVVVPVASVWVQLGIFALGVLVVLRAVQETDRDTNKVRHVEPPPGRDQLKRRRLALAKEITDFVDEQRRLPSRDQIETNEIYRKRFEARVWRYGNGALSAYLQKWESGDELEATAELSDIEDIASRLRLIAEQNEPAPHQLDTKGELEQRHKREQIARWRRMVQTVAQATAKSDEADEKLLLETHEDFPSLKHHLSAETRAELQLGRTVLVGSTIGALLQYILDDIDRLEKKWGLD